MQCKNYKDYSLRINEIIDPNFGQGYAVTFYITKDTGLKEDIHELRCFGKKSRKEVIEIVKKIIDNE